MMKKQPLRIYLAAAWSRRDEIAKVADDLVDAIDGIEITSRWLREPTMFEAKKYRDEKFRRRRAQEDVVDVRRASMIVRFTDDLSGPTVPAKLATGARMFEMGMAYERGNKVVIVGGYQPIFDYLPGVIHLRHIDELKTYLRGLVRRKK
jgi:hypothetical protein